MCSHINALTAFPDAEWPNSGGEPGAKPEQAPAVRFRRKLEAVPVRDPGSSASVRDRLMNTETIHPKTAFPLK